MYFAENEQQLCFNIEVRVPYSQAEAFRDLLTGEDDDIILAAEHAMRDLVEPGFDGFEVELWPEEPKEIRDALVVALVGLED